jgi:hypothetical protein
MGRRRFLRRLWDDYSRTVDCVVLHGGQSFVGLVEGKGCDLGPKIDFSRDLKEVPGIGASHIGHAPKLAFSPQEAVVVKLGESGPDGLR